MEHLPPSSNERDIFQEKPLISIPIPSTKDFVFVRPQKRRGSPASWVFWALLFAALGFGTGHFLIPCVPADTVAQMLEAHIPRANTPLSIVFLRLLVSAVPTGLLLCSAALTGFSGTLISLVFCLRGLIEGFSIYALFGVMTGAILSPDIRFSQRLLLFFTLWTALRFCIRLCLAISARRTATAYFSADKDTPSAMRPLLMRHLAYSLGGFLAAAVGCLAYSICLLHFV